MMSADPDEAITTETANPEAPSVEQEQAPEAEAAAEEQAPEAEAAAEEQAPEADEAAAQLRDSAPHLHGRFGNVLGTTTVGADVVAGDKIEYHVHGSLRVRSVGPIPADDLHRLAARFARPPGFDEAARKLRSNRVLVLRGPRGSGRRMASLRLLDDVLGGKGTVLALDPDAEPEWVLEHLEGDCGHLIADLVVSPDSPLRRLHLDAARQRLNELGGYLVITAEPETTFGETLPDLLDWCPPRPAAVVRAHLSSAGAAGRRTESLLELAETRTYLAGGPFPEEAARFAGLLLAYDVGEASLEDLAGFGAHAAELMTEDCLADPAVPLRDKAFLVALAVFDQSPYPLVAEAADSLYLRLQATERPEATAGLEVFSVARSSRLDLARAVEYEAVPGGRWGARPERLVTFRNDRTWPVVLEHVWLNHPAAREPMLAWLLDLGDDRRTEVRVRAAVATGSLAVADFSFVCDRMIAPWASSRYLRQRQLAAWALVAAIGQGAEPVVSRLLREWAGHGTARRWTVARTCATLGDLAGLSPMRLIRAMARDTVDPQLEAELAQTLGVLLSGQLGLETMRALAEWSGTAGPHRALARRAFTRAAGRRNRDRTAQRSRPVLLDLALANPQAWRDHTDLWRAVLNDAATRPAALDQFGQWVTLAERQPALEGTLARLLPDLATTANERDRLEYKLRHLPAGDATETPPVAERLRQHLLRHPAVAAIAARET